MKTKLFKFSSLVILVFSFSIFFSAHFVHATAPVVPTVTTGEATSIERTSVILNGNITDTGGDGITARGFKYGKDNNSYEKNTTETENAPFGTGEFSAEVTDLDCGKLYYYQSYADNSVDTGSGENNTFTTRACAHHISGSYLPGYGPRVNISVATPVIATPVTPDTTLVTSISQIAKILKKGIISDDVKNIQIYLNTYGFPLALTGAGSTGHETTLFGLLTKKALIKFQLAHGLKGDGILGPETRTIMK